MSAPRAGLRPARPPWGTRKLGAALRFLERGWIAALALTLAVSLPTVARAAASMDAMAWLERMATAARKESYRGVFVYQHGSHSETSRIVHLVEAGQERERLEVLDGPPREVLRDNDEVRCYLPSLRMVILEKEDRRGFPASLPAASKELNEFYLLKKGAISRVAGRESQEIVLEPKDNLRYGHRLWADTGSGLLLKSVLMDVNSQPLEQFTFTEVQIGGRIPREALKSELAESATGWALHDARAAQGVASTGGWSFKSLLPGYSLMAGMKRKLNSNGTVLHLVFSDGMATVSVFVEGYTGAQGQVPGFYKVGSTNVFKRVAGDTLITVLGEVPPSALKRLADGMERN